MNRFLITIAALLFSVAAFGQVNLLSADTVSVKGTTATTGRVITWGYPQNIEGRASIFVGCDSIVGGASKLTKQLKVELRQGVKDAVGGDTLWGQWQVVDSIATTFMDNSDLGTGTGVVEAKQLDPSGMSVWNKQHFIQTRYSFAAGTANIVRIKAVITIN